MKKIGQVGYWQIVRNVGANSSISSTVHTSHFWEYLSGCRIRCKPRYFSVSSFRSRSNVSLTPITSKKLRSASGGCTTPHSQKYRSATSSIFRPHCQHSIVFALPPFLQHVTPCQMTIKVKKFIFKYKTPDYRKKISTSVPVQLIPSTLGVGIIKRHPNNLYLQQIFFR